MKKSVLVAIVSVAVAAILSFLYFYFNTDSSATIGWGILGIIYVFIQSFVGLILRESEIGKGLILGSGLILLIGLSVCTAIWVH